MKMTGFFGSRESPSKYFSWRQERVRDAIEKTTINFSGKRVLDLGCGFGATSEVVADAGAYVCGVDVDATALAYAHQFVTQPTVDLQHVTSYELPFDDNSFDVAILLDVLEHLEHPDKSLSEVHRVLTPGGYLYIESPPFYSITGHHLYD